MSIADWYRRHADDVEVAAKGEAELLFVGDSITQGWEWAPSWKEHFAPHHAANLGVGGDKTQNLLWRLENGGIGKLNPKAIILLIGVNNFGHDHATPAEVFVGVKANIDLLKISFPDSKILALAVFPWGEQPDNPNRALGTAANNLIADLGDSQVTILDIGHVFLENDGTISKTVMGDFLHPTADGYERATNAILPTLHKWLEE